LRASIRSLLLTGVNAEYDGAGGEYIFWLSAVMRLMKEPTCQSKLLMILFGPTTVIYGETVIDWSLFCERTVIPLDLSTTLVKPLSDALHLLLKTKQLGCEEYAWTQHDVFNVIEELSSEFSVQCS
uniref:NAD_binding_4 domain-containing protein n=1 Tax=Nippostrongylus brasiliensis TaxID=27835 RepID=A0A0N4Y760_NIPBR